MPFIAKYRELFPNQPAEFQNHPFIITYAEAYDPPQELTVKINSAAKGR